MDNLLALAGKLRGLKMNKQELMEWGQHKLFNHTDNILELIYDRAFKLGFERGRMMARLDQLAEEYEKESIFSKF